jgi:5'-nucleotidase
MLLNMHPFGNVVVEMEMTGRLLLEALTYGVSRLPAAAGQFPQVSGVTMEVHLTGPERVRNVRVGRAPLDLDRTYTVGLLDFLLTGGDGYSMFARAKTLVSAEAGELLVSVMEKYMSARRTVSPAIEKRINIVR